MEVRETQVVEIWYEKEEVENDVSPKEVKFLLEKRYSIQIEQTFKNGQKYYKLQKTKPEKKPNDSVHLIY